MVKPTDQRRAIASLLLVLIVLPGESLAWSASGHHLISLIAFDLLTESEQAELLSILAAHPRYEDDFTPPLNVSNVDSADDHGRLSRGVIESAQAAHRERAQLNGQSFCIGTSRIDCNWLSLETRSGCPHLIRFLGIS
jgi:hypothetical protein